MITESNYEKKYNDLLLCLRMVRVLLKQYTLPPEESCCQNFKSTQDMARYFLELVGTLLPEEMK